MDLGILITSICTSLSAPGYWSACGTAFQATLVQSHVQDNVDHFVKYVNDEGFHYYKAYVAPVTGEQVWISGVLAYKVVKSRQISKEFRVKSLIDTVKVEANPSGGTLSVGWRF